MQAHTLIPSPAGSPVAGRRNITHLREGAAVPGYTGYHPTYKYMIGTSTGTGSHNIYLDRHGQPSPEQCFPGSISPPHSPRLAPIPDGGIHKYTQDMKPGYTGYIPTSRFKYGSRYKATCDVSLEEHLGGVEKRELDREDMNTYSRTSPRLVPRTRGTLIKTKLDSFSDGSRSNSSSPVLNDFRIYSPPEHAKRSFLEAPKPGYTGYVPYIQHTDHGLGVRYASASQHGLKAFANNHHKYQRLSPVSRESTISTVSEAAQRLYLPGGMKPKYTGYIPHNRYVIGKTYGTMVRESSACNHKNQSYGHHRREAEQLEEKLLDSPRSPRQWQEDPKNAM